MTKKKCFVVCPIGEEGSEIRKNSDQLLKHVIAPALKELDFDIERSDLINHTGKIDSVIIEKLNSSELVIADLSGLNANVFYEVGYRAALGLPMIQIMNKETVLPFDVSTTRTISYNLTDLDAVDSTVKSIKNTAKTFDFEKTKSSRPAIKQDTLETILQMLLKIQDDISSIDSKVSSSENSAVSVLADKLSQNNVKTDNQVMMETVFPALLNNPSLLEYFVKLSKNED